MHFRQMYRVEPVGDFQSSRWGGFTAGGGFGCDPHPTELFIVVFIPLSSRTVTGSTAVPGAQGSVTLLQVNCIQVSIHFKGHRAGPALSRDSLTGFNL